MMTRQIAAILRKDLLIERRSKANLNALVVLATLLVLVVSFAVGPSAHRLHLIAGGVLWIALAFAGMLAFARAYQPEVENRAFEGMLLMGADPKAIYLAKLLMTVLVMLVVELVVGAVMALLYGISVLNLVTAVALFGIPASVGLGAVGVLYGRLTMNSRAREIMLPLLVLPVVIPALLAAAKGSSLTLSTSSIPWSGLSIWVELLVVFDVIFVAAGILTFESLTEES